MTTVGINLILGINIHQFGKVIQSKVVCCIKRSYSYYQTLENETSHRFHMHVDCDEKVSK